MMITPGKRHLLLVLALGGTVLAAVLAPRDGDDDVIQAAPHAPRLADAATGKPSTNADASSLQVSALLPRHNIRSTPLFVVPPPPRPVFVPTVAAGPVKPVDPPLPPYHVVGRYNTGDKQMVLLANGADTQEVVAGDAVANGWRVDRIDDDSVIFVSPSGNQQLLAIDAQDYEKH